MTKGNYKTQGRDVIEIKSELVKLVFLNQEKKSAQFPDPSMFFLNITKKKTN